LTDSEALRQENDALQQRCAELLARALDAEEAFEAFARGEVDAITVGTSSTPFLLRAAQEELHRSEQALRESRDLL
jgi:hypothetical protein